jgi:hypothetical protein
MRRLALLAAVPLVLLLPVRADALTVRDIVELTRAGLGDEILLALIEVDGPVFPIDTETLKRLKAVGVSERVIVAMVRSGRARTDLQAPAMISEPQPARVEPQVVVIDHHDAPEVREVPVAVPVYVPYAIRSRSDDTDHNRNRDDSARDSSRDGNAAHVKPAEPVYWGFGGKLRPDAWQPEPAPAKKKQ